MRDVKVQVKVTEEQAAHLARRAAANGTTALDKPAFRADVPDLSLNHDEYFVQAIEERIGRR